jgi:hypothetical protein
MRWWLIAGVYQPQYYSQGSERLPYSNPADGTWQPPIFNYNFSSPPSSSSIGFVEWIQSHVAVFGGGNQDPAIQGGLPTGSNPSVTGWNFGGVTVGVSSFTGSPIPQGAGNGYSIFPPNFVGPGIGIGGPNPPFNPNDYIGPGNPDYVPPKGVWSPDPGR